MKLTPEQKRGIEERFAVLADHIEGHILREYWPQGEKAVARASIQDIEACRDEVLVLIERLESELLAASLAALYEWHSNGWNNDEMGEAMDRLNSAVKGWKHEPVREGG